MSAEIPPGIARFAAEARCPDCTADIGPPTQDELGIWHIEWRHDDTCPTLARLESLAGPAPTTWQAVQSEDR